jgi:hypothetical protein
VKTYIVYDPVAVRGICLVEATTMAKARKVLALAYPGNTYTLHNLHTCIILVAAETDVGGLAAIGWKATHLTPDAGDLYSDGESTLVALPGGEFAAS